jgi:dienelactone hydrolase
MSSALIAVNYSAEGQALTGYLAEPAGVSTAAAVLVAHEAVGINDHIKDRAGRLAALGYTAFAIDLYGTSDLPSNEARLKSAELMSTPGLLLTRAAAGLKTFLDMPRVDVNRLAAIGFCQGGSTILELARTGAPLKAVVGFHPGYHRPTGSRDGPIAARVLMLSGDEDPVVSAEDKAAFADEMRRAKADWQLHLFGGVGHSFTNKRIDEYGLPGFAYDAAADRRSWQMMQSLLTEVFGPGASDR